MDFSALSARLPEHASLDSKIEMLKQAAGEDVRVYNFDDEEGGERYDGLGDTLDETANDLNDETFGDMDDVGRDFDFSGGNMAASQPPPRQKPRTAWDHPPFPSKNKDDKLGWSSLDVDPLLGPQMPSSGKPNTIDHLASTTQSSSKPPNALTLDEIEADIHQQKSAISQPPLKKQQQHQQRQPPSGRPLTLEEIESQLFTQPGHPEPITTSAVPTPPSMGTHSQPSGAPSAPVSVPQAYYQPPPQQDQANANLQLLQQRVDNVQIQDPPPPPPPDSAPPSQMINAFYPPLPTESPSIPPPMPFISSQQKLSNMHKEAEQLRRNTDLQSIERLQSLEKEIEQQERIEQSRRRKGRKIAEMSKYNGLMSQSEKDFITRIQVSQLVKSMSADRSYDPYADDFYFHIYKSLHSQKAERSALSPSHQGSGTQKSDNDKNATQSGEYVRPDRRLTRRENAMLRMAQRVQRIVDEAPKKQDNESAIIEGALGRKIERVGATPRHAISVPTHSKVTESFGGNLPQLAETQKGAGKPLNGHEALLQIERIYDGILEIEQMRRTQPQPHVPQPDSEESAEDIEKAKRESEENIKDWEARYQSKVSALWDNLKINVPLDYSDPHPFVSILSSAKGKKLLPRVLRVADMQITLTILTLLLATFDSLDVVKHASVLDTVAAPGSQEAVFRAKIENETEVFFASLIPALMKAIESIPLRMVSGMIGLLMNRTNIVSVAHTKPGVSVLTLLLTRAQILKGDGSSSQDDLSQWAQTYSSLFSKLQNSMLSLFPSNRIRGVDLSPYDANMEMEDGSVWQFLAALAFTGTSNEQQALVTAVREKVLNEISVARQPACPPNVASMKLADVNIFLQSLGLDASMIS